jgi:hypothetical protein
MTDETIPSSGGDPAPSTQPADLSAQLPEGQGADPASMTSANEPMFPLPDLDHELRAGDDRGPTMSDELTPTPAGESPPLGPLATESSGLSPEAQEADAASTPGANEPLFPAPEMDRIGLDRGHVILDRRLAERRTDKPGRIWSLLVGVARPLAGKG